MSSRRSARRSRARFKKVELTSRLKSSSGAACVPKARVTLEMEKVLNRSRLLSTAVRVYTQSAFWS